MNANARNPLKTCLAPDPEPISPAWIMPPGACDAHCHVFGPAARFPYSADRSYTPPDAPVEILRRLHRRLGISRAVIVHASCHGTEMDVTLDAIASSKGAYRGVACVKDSVTDRELECLHDAGIRGIRFNFVKHLGGVPDLDVFHRLVARIKPLGWHIVLHRRLGISRAVIVHASCHGTEMDVTLDAIASSKGAYRGVACVKDSVTDRELECLHDAGIRGIRFNFVKHLGGVPDLDVFHRLVARIKPLGWHIVLHVDAEDILARRDLLDRIDVPFIIDHMGRVKAAEGLDQRPFQSLIDLYRHNPLAWIKVCGAERVSAGKRPFRDALPFAQALIAVDATRILWGTDWPHPNITKDMPNDGELVDLFGEICPDAGLRTRILVDNPTRLYWAG